LSRRSRNEKKNDEGSPVKGKIEMRENMTTPGSMFLQVGYNLQHSKYHQRVEHCSDEGLLPLGFSLEARTSVLGIIRSKTIVLLLG